MPVIVLPDVTGGVVARVRSFAETLTLVSTSAGWTDGATTPRVSPVKQNKWALPTHAIWIDGPKSGPEGNDNQGRRVSRYHFNFYGPGELKDIGTQKREAMRLWRTMHPALCPRQEGKASFVAASCRFTDVRLEGGPIADVEVDTGWGFVLATYIFKWDEVPVS